MGKALDVVAPIAGATLGSVVPGLGTYVGASLGAGLGSGAANYSHNHDFGSALKSAGLSAAGSYAGASLGNAFLGDKLGTVGNALSKNTGINLGSSVAGDSIGAKIGNFAGNVAPGISNSIANTSIGSLAGSYAGNSIASGLVPQKAASSVGEGATSEFNPTQETEQASPFSGMSGLSPQQQSSNIATEGVYGGGAGPQEQSYFLNLINRRLFDDSGHMSGNTGGIAPIENSYLNQLGIKGDNPSNLLEAISKWRTQQAA